MTDSRRSIRHDLALGLALIIAGLLTTVAVAWAIPVLRAYLPESVSNSPAADLDLSTPQTITREYTNGWPFACASSHQTITISRSAIGPIVSTRTIDAYSIDLRRSPTSVTVVLLASRPLPLGLLVNTLLYAGAWFALYRLALALRARHRARKNQCVKCTYDLQGSSTHCPECGHPLSASASA